MQAGGAAKQAEVVTPSQLRKLRGESGPSESDAAGNTKSRAGASAIVNPVKTKPDTAFFWSGRTGAKGGADNAAAMAAERGGTTLETLLAERKIDMPTWDTNNPEVVSAWKRISAQYAEGASGKVRAVIGENLRPGNVWETSELPALTKNPNVTEIIKIDPASGAETIIFKR